jgi:hypothetical protein
MGRPDLRRACRLSDALRVAVVDGLDLLAAALDAT